MVLQNCSMNLKFKSIEKLNESHLDAATKNMLSGSAIKSMIDGLKYQYSERGTYNKLLEIVRESFADK